MMAYISKKRAQSSLEYVVLITILLGVFVSIGTYFKRGVQGRWKSATDDLADQYDPLTVDTNITYTLTSDTDTQLNSIDDGHGVWTFRRDSTRANERKNGFLQVNP